MSKLVKTLKAVALDIDGVFLRGRNLLPGAVKALNILKEYRIAHIFVTNGGGTTELSKSQSLSEKFGIHIRPDQILLCHTPLQKLACQFGADRVLILGHHRCLDVAEDYGFKFVVSAQQLHSENPSIYPGRAPADPISRHLNHRDKKIAAAMIFHDPLDWALEMQVLSDALLGDFSDSLNQNTYNNGQQVIPLYATNADLLYTTEHPRTRYTQGTFVNAFRTVFQDYSGQNLAVQFCGKPYNVQYKFAEQMLKRECAQIHGTYEPHNLRFYGVGDNPKSDIRGARNAGEHWKSLLVRSGVFQSSHPGDNDLEDPADVVVDGVLDAIRWIAGDAL